MVDEHSRITNIAVTGVGIVCAIGNNTNEVLSSLQHNKSGIEPVRYLQTIHKELPVGEVKMSDEEIKAKLDVDKSEVVSRTALIGALALRQAIADADVDCDRLVTFINGTTVGGMDVTEHLLINNELSSIDDAQRKILHKHDCGSNSEETAQLAGLKNVDICTVSTACSSALNAIILGCDMLRNGETDIVIAGGAEALSVFHLNGFNTLMILDKQQCRPFSDDRAGLNLGEGAAYVVLERSSLPLTPSSKRGMLPYAYIAGYSNACDAFHQTATSDNGEGAYLAISEALEMAGVQPSQIDYINAHGTGTPNNDATEIVAMQRVFGEDIPDFSSTKSLTGHATSASGSIETVICMLAMQQGFIPIHKNSADLACVMCNSFGFGGNDSSLILTKTPISTPTFLLSDGERPWVRLFSSVVSSDEQLNDIRRYVSPMEARRMGRLLKGAVITSMNVLQEAGLDIPDAIITATKYGMLENSEKFLMEIAKNGESLLKPTLFMQSTHNTIGSAIAIRLKCHGYNMTYTQGNESFNLALKDASRLLNSGKVNNVLIIQADEMTEHFADITDATPGFYVKSILMKI